MVSIGQKIYDMVADMMYSAKLDSPRFDDYQIYAVESDPGLISDIDNEIENNAKQIVETKEVQTTQQDSHVKAYGKFMRDSDITNRKGMPYVKDALEFMQNPQGKFIKMATDLFKDFGRMIPLVGPLIIAAFAIPEIAKQVTKVVTSRGWYFDMTFRKNLETLVNRLRPLEQQQSIRAGFTQVIFTSRAGTPYERDSYNTYVQVNNSNRQSDLYWSIRDPYGVAIS